MGLEKEAGDCSQRGQLSRLSKKMPQENQRIPQRDNFWFTFKWLGRTGRNLAPLDPQLQDAAEKKPEDCQLHLTKNHGPEVIGAETRMEPTEKLPHGRHKQKRKHSSRCNQRNQLYSRRQSRCPARQETHESSDDTQQFTHRPFPFCRKHVNCLLTCNLRWGTEKHTWKGIWIFLVLSDNGRLLRIFDQLWKLMKLLHFLYHRSL